MTGLADRPGMRAAGSRSWRLLIPRPQTGPADQHRILPNGPGIPQLGGSQGLTSCQSSTRTPCFQNQMEATSLPKEMSSASVNPPSGERNLGLGDSGPARDPHCCHRRGPGTWGCWGMWSGPGSAHGAWPAGGKRLKPDIALLVFPIKKKRPFYLLFRDLEDIFNSSSFLPSTGVSYGMAIAVGKDGAKT